MLTKKNMYKTREKANGKKKKWLQENTGEQTLDSRLKIAATRRRTSGARNRCARYPQRASQKGKEQRPKEKKEERPVFRVS